MGQGILSRAEGSVRFNRDTGETDITIMDGVRIGFGFLWGVFAFFGFGAWVVMAVAFLQKTLS